MSLLTFAGNFTKVNLEFLPTVTLSDLALTANSQTNSFSISATASNIDIGITTIPFSVVKLTMTDVGRFNFTSLAFSGNYTKGSITIPVSVAIPLGGGLFQLAFGSEKNPIALSEISALAAFVGGDSSTLFNALPPDLQNLGFGVRNFEISFDTSTQAIHGASVTIESTRKWTLIDDVIEVDDICVSLGIQRFSYTAGKNGAEGSWGTEKISWSVFGTVGLGSVKTNISVNCNSVSLDVDITPVKGMSIADLTALFGGTDFMSHLPKGLSIVENISLQYILASITPPDQATHTPAVIRSLSFSVQTTNTWNIIPGWLSVEQVGITPTIYNPFAKATRVVTMRVFGRMTFDDVHIYLNGDYPDGELIADIQDLTLGEIAASFLPPETTVPEQITDIAFSNIQLALDPSASSYSISAISAGTWVITNSELTLSNLIINVNHDGNTGHTLFNPMGNITISDLEFFLSADNSSGSWVLSGNSCSTIHLTAIVENLFGFSSAPPLVPDVEIAVLRATINHGTKDYTFSCSVAVDWSSDKFGGLPLPEFQASVSIRSSIRDSKRIYSGSLKGKTTIEGETLSVQYDFVPNSKDFKASYDGFTCTIKKINSDTIIDLQLGSLTLGSLVEYVAQKVDPGVSLQSPWDILNDIDLHDLIIQMNLTKKSGGVWFDCSKDLGFLNIQAIGIFYQKAISGGGRKSIDIKIQGDFLEKTYTKNEPLNWDITKNNGPSIAGKGSSMFDLRYLGIGQHVAFTSTKNLNSIYDVLHALGDSYTPPKQANGVAPPGSGHSGNPLAAIKALEYDAASSWLIGGDISLIDTITLGVIFNDPKL
ncbi:MAG: hypothetical protein GKR95_25430 [Gammaproteobacteria bacterium]|nr:hypothetical protein [Gammaproteobacteria bacterium]